MFVQCEPMLAIEWIAHESPPPSGAFKNFHEIGDVDESDALPSEPKPFKLSSKKRRPKEEDESQRLTRIMAICAVEGVTVRSPRSCCLNWGFGAVLVPLYYSFLKNGFVLLIFPIDKPCARNDSPAYPRNRHARTSRFQLDNISCPQSHFHLTSCPSGLLENDAAGQGRYFGLEVVTAS